MGSWWKLVKDCHDPQVQGIRCGLIMVIALVLFCVEPVSCKASVSITNGLTIHGVDETLEVHCHSADNDFTQLIMTSVCSAWEAIYQHTGFASTQTSLVQLSSRVTLEQFIKLTPHLLFGKGILITIHTIIAMIATGLLLTRASMLMAS
jgi:hypothetical protein